MNVSRRTLLMGGLAITGAGVLAGCSGDPSALAPTASGDVLIPTRTPLSPRPGQRVVSASLTAQQSTVDLGGRMVDTWTFGESLPGTVIRARAGDLIRVDLDNRLAVPTSIHWHGIALRNEADGVPGLTQEAVPTGGTFRYEFVAPDPGTYFYHPHVGVQLDRGLYAPLIIDDPRDPGDYDHEWVVVLDDWVDGTGRTPDDVLAEFTAASSAGGDGDMSGMDMSGMDMSGESTSGPFGDAGDVQYPYYLINGRLASQPEVLRARPGQRVRLRVINAGADTIFAVALGGHRLTITETDGFAVQPMSTGAFYLGMGERYDCVVTLEDGVFPLVAQPVGKKGRAMALIRTGGGRTPQPDVAVRELEGPISTVDDLAAMESALLPSRQPGQVVDLRLQGQMSPYAWSMNGAAYPDNPLVSITPNERVRVNLVNETMMSHPLHIHGHTFALPSGVRKDTVMLKPRQSMPVELQADNPGNWAAHCHNIYHAEAGMMAALVYAAT